MRSFIKILLILLTISIQVHSQQLPPEFAVFDSLHDSVSKLRVTIIKLDLQNKEITQIKEWLDNIEENTTLLQNIVRSQPHLRAPKEYWSSLNSDAELLKDLTTTEPRVKFDKKRLFRVLENVAVDLKIKAKHAKSSLGTGLRLVQVIVHTKRRSDGQEVNGFRLWYVQRAWEGTTNRYKQADRLSSPVFINVAPGIYLLWLSKDQTTSNSEPFHIGEDGKSVNEIDLEIP